MSTFRVQVRAACQAQMNEHAERAFPEECCGVMFGRDRDDGVREVVEVRGIDNTKDENRKRRYLIDPMDLYKAEKYAREKGFDVVGIYHSHPDHPSQASEFDREHAMPHWSYLIVSCMAGKTASVQSWRLRDDRSQFDEELLSYDEA